MSAKDDRSSRKTLREKRRMFQRFIREYDAPLRRRARRLLYGSSLRYHEGEDDLMQDTFLKVWRFLDGYNERGNALSWLMAVLWSVFLQHFREMKRKYGNCVGGETGEYFLQSVSSGEGVEWNVAVGIDRKDIRGHFEQIPEPNRLPVILYDLEEKNYKEIAQICGIPVGTVKSRIHRGRKILKQNGTLRILLETA